MTPLPDGLRPYKRTPVFTAETVPPGLLRDHATKPGVWGLIHVVSGEVIYRIALPKEEHLLAPGTLGVIEPDTPHSVEILGAGTFFVEFWKAGAL